MRKQIKSVILIATKYCTKSFHEIKIVYFFRGKKRVNKTNNGEKIIKKCKLQMKCTHISTAQTPAQQTFMFQKEKSWKGN